MKERSLRKKLKRSRGDNEIEVGRCVGRLVRSSYSVMSACIDHNDDDDDDDLFLLHLQITYTIITIIIIIIIRSPASISPLRPDMSGPLIEAIPDLHSLYVSWRRSTV
jgi:hypothetical protein